jgi:hypothetical protein
MIAKRIPHKTECDHAQTPYARRKCRAAKLAAIAVEESAMQQKPEIPTVIDGYEIPDNAADVRGWYSYAADNAAMYADDDRSRQARAAYRELHAARQAMELHGLRHGGPR